MGWFRSPDAGVSKGGQGWLGIGAERTVNSVYSISVEVNKYRNSHKEPLLQDRFPLFASRFYGDFLGPLSCLQTAYHREVIWQSGPANTSAVIR
jgi:hypothetical protein